VTPLTFSRFPSRVDFDFYQSRLALPPWAARLGRVHIVDIDVVVNSHGQVRYTQGELTTHNLLALLRRYRNDSAGLRCMLQDLARDPQCVIQPAKRSALARKWLRRIS
jgi:hypothetical protein